jgi:diacylglycerol kinase family enzyme
MLDIVIVNKMNKVLTALSILKQIAAGKVLKNITDVTKKKPIYYLHSNNILIQNPSLAPLHIDGEPIETAKTVQIKIIPSAFRLIMKV